MRQLPRKRSTATSSKVSDGASFKVSQEKWTPVAANTAPTSRCMRSTEDFDGACSKSRKMATRGVVWPVTHRVALAPVDHSRAERPRTITLNIEAATIAHFADLMRLRRFEQVCDIGVPVHGQPAGRAVPIPARG